MVKKSKFNLEYLGIGFLILAILAGIVVAIYFAAKKCPPPTTAPRTPSYDGGSNDPGPDSRGSPGSPTAPIWSMRSRAARTNKAVPVVTP